MGNSTRLLQRRLEQWKTAATQFIAGPEEEEDNRTVVLDPAIFEQCQQEAEAQQISVNEWVHYILEQHVAAKSADLLVPISREQLERNPLLYLDALAERNINLYGEPKYEYEQS